MEEHDAAEPFHIVYAEKFFKFLHSAQAFAQSMNNLAAQIQRIELVVQKVMTFVAFQQQLQQRCSFWKIADTNDDSSSDSSEECTSSSTPQDKLNALSPKERFLDKDYLEIDSHDKQVLKEKLQSLNMSIVQVDVTPATEYHDNDCSNSCSTIGTGREHVCCTVRGVLQKGYDLNILLGVPSDKDENVSENTGQNVCASENQGFNYFKETAEDHSNRINDSGEEEAHSLGSLPGLVEGTDSDVLEQELSMNGDSKESCMQDLEQSAICEKIDKEDDGNNYWKNNCSHCLADNSGIHKDIESTNRNILDDNGSSNLEQVCHDLKEVAGNEFKDLDVREAEEFSNDLKGSDAFGNGSLVEAISTKNLGSENNDSVLVNQCQQLSLVRASPDSGPTEINQGGDQLPNTFSNAFINGLQLIEFIHRKMGTFQWTNTIEASESEHEMKTDTFVQGCSINSESSVQNVADVKDSVGTVYLCSDSNSSNFTEPINNESNGVTTEYLEENLEGQLLSDCTSESKDSTSANSRISSSTKEGKTCGETFSVQQGPHTICSADSAQPGPSRAWSDPNVTAADIAAATPSTSRGLPAAEACPSPSLCAAALPSTSRAPPARASSPCVSRRTRRRQRQRRAHAAAPPQPPTPAPAAAEGAGEADERAPASLAEAAAGGFTRALRRFIQRGEDVGARDARGDQPLHAAARAGRAAAAEALLQHGASAVARGRHGHTPLHAAALAGHEEVVRVLLRWDATAVDARDACGATALALAAGAGHAGVVAQLLDHDADATLRDARGRTPLQRARAARRDAVVALMLFDPAACAAAGLGAGPALDPRAPAHFPELVDFLHYRASLAATRMQQNFAPCRHGACARPHRQ